MARDFSRRDLWKLGGALGGTALSLHRTVSTAHAHPLEDSNTGETDDFGDPYYYIDHVKDFDDLFGDDWFASPYWDILTIEGHLRDRTERGKWVKGILNELPTEPSQIYVTKNDGWPSGSAWASTNQIELRIGSPANAMTLYADSLDNLVWLEAHELTHLSQYPNHGTTPLLRILQEEELWVRFQRFDDGYSTVVVEREPYLTFDPIPQTRGALVFHPLLEHKRDSFLDKVEKAYEDALQLPAEMRADPAEIVRYVTLTQLPWQEQYEHDIVKEVQGEFASSLWGHIDAFSTLEAVRRAQREFQQYQDRGVKQVSVGGIEQLARDVSTLYGIFRTIRDTDPSKFSIGWVHNQVTRRLENWAQHVNGNGLFYRIREETEVARAKFGDPSPVYDHLGSVLTFDEILLDEATTNNTVTQYLEENPYAREILAPFIQCPEQQLLCL